MALTLAQERKFARHTARGFTDHAVEELAKRYNIPSGGTMLAKILSMIRQGEATKLPAHGGRWIWDLTYETSQRTKKSFPIRVLTDGDVTCILTVLPTEFRRDVREQRHEQRRQQVKAQAKAFYRDLRNGELEERYED